MAFEELKQGVVIPLVNFTPEHYSNLEDSLRTAPGFSTDADASTRILTQFSALNLTVIPRSQILYMEKHSRGSESAKSSKDDLEAFLQEEFIEAPWPAEIPTAPVRINQNKRDAKTGRGSLVAADKSGKMAVASMHIQDTLLRYYNLRSRSEAGVSIFTPDVRLAYARDPREFKYLRHLKALINNPHQSILPAMLEPGEQLRLL